MQALSVKVNHPTRINWLSDTTRGIGLWERNVKENETNTKSKVHDIMKCCALCGLVTSELEKDLRKKTDEYTEGKSYEECKKYVLGQISIQKEPILKRV